MKRFSPHSLLLHIFTSAALIAGILLLILVGAFIVTLLTAIPRLVSNVQPEIFVPVVTALLGFFLYLLQNYHTKSREIREAHRPRKIQCYSDFSVQLLEFLLTNSKLEPKQKAGAQKATELAIRNFTKEATLWASPAVIKAFNDFKESLTNPTIHPTVRFENLLRAFREDLGHTNSRLRSGELTATYVNDRKKVDKLFATSNRTTAEK